MRDIDKQLIEEEFKRVDCDYAEELQLTYDFIVETFKHWQVKEYTDHFYDQDCPEWDCTQSSCEDCHKYDDYKGSKEQLSTNNWVDIWGEGIWGESQQSVDERVKQILISILDDEDINYRLWTFERDGYRFIYYYNRDRFSDNWFCFEKKHGNSTKLVKGDNNT